MDSAKKTQASKPLSSAPSGIAQLRKSVDHSADQHCDPMNLDDFLVPTSIASPAGISPAPMPDLASAQNTYGTGTSKMREKSHISIPTGMPASSVPKTSIPTTRGGEFDYVQKRVRKTSIDERRVRHLVSFILMLCALLRACFCARGLPHFYYDYMDAVTLCVCLFFTIAHVHNVFC